MKVHVKKNNLGLVILWIVAFNLGFVPDGNAKSRDVRVLKHGAGQWELLVDGKPYFVKGVVYNFWVVGDDHNTGTLRDWSVLDTDKNGRVDVGYDSWVDKNRNNVQDADEPAVGDWQLLQEMGANTIRVYQMPSADPRIEHLYIDQGQRLTFAHPPNKEIFRDLYQRYGIMTMVGHFFGEWTIGSGAKWEQGTDFTDPGQRENLLTGIRVMVEEHKDEPYTLMWVIGNENFNPWDQDNAEKQVEAYLSLVNEAAKLIHKLDPHHPVALCNWVDRNIEQMLKYCPAVDIFGLNSYSRRFDPVWQKARRDFDRPVLLTEYGLPAIVAGKENGIVQARYYEEAWADIVANKYGGTGVGNSIGGALFVWCDQWALAGNPWQHDSGQWMGVAGVEWFGVTSQGDGSKSPFMRQLRESYFLYQKMWKE
jgi:beta-glucuronidase